MSLSKKEATQNKILHKLERLRFIKDNNLSQKEYWPKGKLSFAVWEDSKLNIEKVSRPTLDVEHNKQIWKECSEAIEALHALSERRIKRKKENERIKTERDQLREDVSQFANQIHTYLFQIRTLEKELEATILQRDRYRERYFEIKEQLEKVLKFES